MLRLSELKANMGYIALSPTLKLFALQNLKRLLRDKTHMCFYTLQKKNPGAWRFAVPHAREQDTGR